ncbi:unnamed protein product [Rangifer tarandus platyrhynchus]|uniref:Uncharacterized protein n=1 Tax=Rangifer tarandus platyrhynchus TaxID=3082113 RepID=A0AC59ZWM6_RANTA
MRTGSLSCAELEAAAAGNSAIRHRGAGPASRAAGRRTEAFRRPDAGTPRRPRGRRPGGTESGEGDAPCADRGSEARPLSAARRTQTSPAARGAVIAADGIPPRRAPAQPPSLLGTLGARAPRKDRTHARAHARRDGGEPREPLRGVVPGAIARTAAPQPAAAS